MPLGEKVKKARERLGLTQVQLAKLASISQTTISEIENGKSADVSSRILFQLADSLAVEARSLVTENEAELVQRPPFHDEEAIINLFRLLSLENQRLLKGIAQVMIDTSPKNKAAPRR